MAGNEKPGALFMYENADKQRISLLVRKDAEHSRETAFRYAQEDGVGVFYWIDDELRLRAVGQHRQAAAAFDRARRVWTARCEHTAGHAALTHRTGALRSRARA